MKISMEELTKQIEEAILSKLEIRLSEVTYPSWEHASNLQVELVIGERVISKDSICIYDFDNPDDYIGGRR